MKNAVADEQPDRRQRHQFQDRFQRHRHHHARMVLVGMKAAAAEEHGEDRQHYRGPKGTVRKHRRGGGIGNRLTGGERRGVSVTRERLQLSLEAELGVQSAQRVGVAPAVSQRLELEQNRAVLF